MLTRLSENMWVFRGPLNVGVVTDQGSALLIDFGTGDVLGALADAGINKTAMVLITHHHRDQACGARRLSKSGARIGVPKEERWLFDDVARYWEDPNHRWHLYNFHPHHLALVEPLVVDLPLSAGDRLEWGPAHLEVLPTPGHTDGSLSYVAEVDDIRAAFVGDLIYGAGKVWEVFSMQKGNGTTDYHGFLGSRNEVTESLNGVLSRRPTHLVPSHGEIMERPREAVVALENNLRACYESYASVSSLRHYFPHLFEGYLSGPRVMPMGKELNVPGCLHHIGTTWLLVSAEGYGLAMDCGSGDVIDELRCMLSDGRLRGIDGVWITHYHDDHVDFLNEFTSEFGCPIIAEEHVAEIVENPLAWRLPCISPERVRVNRRVQDGESWEWREHVLTSYHLPGQTLYSGALLVEGGGTKMLFSGDSFTPGGIDDHCCANRNLLGKGVGYDRCIQLVREIKPDMIFNSHVNSGFAFTTSQLDFIAEEVERRRQLFVSLLPWEDPNMGMDEHWARCEPYEQWPDPGCDVTVDVVITNHGPNPIQASARVLLPASWPQAAGFIEAVAEPGREYRIPQRVHVPEECDARRWIIPIDLTVNDRYLPQFTEAILDTRPNR